MRRRIALSVIGGAVAAMATPLSLGAASGSTWRHWTSNVSVREKCIRALALVMRLLDRKDMLHPVWYMNYVAPIGVNCGKVIVSRNAGPSKFITVISKDEWYNLQGSEVYDDTSIVATLAMEIEYWRKQELSKIIGLDIGDRDLARDVLAQAFGMIIGRDVCDPVVLRRNIVRLYGPEQSPSSLAGATNYGRKLRGIVEGELGDGTALSMLQEIIRGINDLKSSFVLSELRQVQTRCSFPHAYPCGPKWDVLTGSRCPIPNGELSLGRYRHIDESRIDTGYLCPQTGQAVAGESGYSMHCGWFWRHEHPPEFCTDGVTVTVTDDGDGFAVDVSTSLWVNKESLQNVIAFAVPKV